MTPRRLLEENPHSIEAQLLRAGQAMQPPSAMFDMTLASLGVGVKAIGSANCAATTASSSVFGSVWVATALKGLAIGVLAGGSVVGVAEVSSRDLRSTNTARANVTALARASVTPVGTRALVSSPTCRTSTESTTATAPQESALPTEEQPQEGTSKCDAARQVHSNGPMRLSAVGTTKAQHSLGAEVALIDRTRRAIEEGQLTLATECLNQHAREFSHPRLAQEASFLRARVLEHQGRHAEAEAAIRDFRRKHPDSALSERDLGMQSVK